MFVKSKKTVWERDRKAQFEKIFYFRSRPATESRHLGKSQGYRKGTWLLRWDDESPTIVGL